MSHWEAHRKPIQEPQTCPVPHMVSPIIMPAPFWQIQSFIISLKELALVSGSHPSTDHTLLEFSQQQPGQS